MHTRPEVSAPALCAGLKTRAPFSGSDALLATCVHSCLNALLGLVLGIPLSGTGAQHCVYVCLMQYLIWHLCVFGGSLSV